MDPADIGAMGLVAPACAEGDRKTGKKAGKKIAKQLKRGQAAFQDQDYEKAIRRLRKVADNDRASEGQRTRALELVGLAQFILGKRRRARETFVELVVMNPGYDLRDDFGSAEIRETFEQVKNEFLEENAPVELKLSRVVPVRSGQRATIEVDVEIGDEQVKEIVVMARGRGGGDYRQTAMTPKGENRWRARVPTPLSTQNFVLEYYIESRDIGGRANARLGNPGEPRTLDIGARASKPWYRRWYTIAGGVAVIGIATVLIATAGD